MSPVALIAAALASRLSPFGATMGNTASDGSRPAQSPFDALAPEERRGWKVLAVSPGSPCAGLGLVPYFSVLTHLDGTLLGSEEGALVPLVQEGRALRMA